MPIEERVAGMLVADAEAFVEHTDFARTRSELAVLVDPDAENAQSNTSCCTASWISPVTAVTRVFVCWPRE